MLPCRSLVDWLNLRMDGDNEMARILQWILREFREFRERLDECGAQNSREHRTGLLTLFHSKDVGHPPPEFDRSSSIAKHMKKVARRRLSGAWVSLCI